VNLGQLEAMFSQDTRTCSQACSRITVLFVLCQVFLTGDVPITLPLRQRCVTLASASVSEQLNRKLNDTNYLTWTTLFRCLVLRDRLFQWALSCMKRLSSLKTRTILCTLNVCRTVCSPRMGSSKCAHFRGMKPCNRPESMQHAPMHCKRVRTNRDFWTSRISMIPRQMGFY
jgi:hypothetical protein